MIVSNYIHLVYSLLNTETPTYAKVAVAYVCKLLQKKKENGRTIYLPEKW